MGHISKERYEQKKIDRLLNHLRIYHEKGHPIDFEIFVDGFKAVRRTNDLDMFSLYEDFVDADTKTVEFLFYTGNSNNNHKHIFTFGSTQASEQTKEDLSGVDVEERIEEGVQRRLREARFTELEAENKELQEEIRDLEKDINRLEREKAEILSRQSPLNSVLGEFGSSFVESLIRRNPKIVSALPGGEALAGLLQSDNAEPASEQSPESEVSFKPKSTAITDDGNTPSESDQAAIYFVEQLKAKFTREEFDKVLCILQALAEDKDKIDVVLNHLIQPTA